MNGRNIWPFKRTRNEAKRLMVVRPSSGFIVGIADPIVFCQRVFFIIEWNVMYAIAKWCFVPSKQQPLPPTPPVPFQFRCCWFYFCYWWKVEEWRIRLLRRWWRCGTVTRHTNCGSFPMGRVLDHSGLFCPQSSGGGKYKRWIVHW